MCCGGKEDALQKERAANYAKADLSDPNYEGEIIPAKYSTGPQNERNCTDILCCLIFCFFMAAAAQIALTGLAEGQPEKLAAVYDGAGKMCKLSPGYEDYSYIYFWLPMPGYFNKTTCVKECPQFLDNATMDAEIRAMYEDVSTNPPTPPPAANQLECKTTPLVPQCYGKSLNTESLMSLTGISGDSGGLSQDEIMQQTFLIYPTAPRFYRFCVPVAINETLSQYYSQVAGMLEDMDSMTEMAEDVKVAQGFIFAAGFIAMFFGFIWMVVMKACAGPITWTAIIIFLLSLFGITYYTYELGLKEQERIASIDWTQTDEKEPYNYKLYMSYGFAGISAIFFCAIICLYSRIRIAIAIMETSADFVTEVPLVMLVPPVITIFVLLWAFIWVVLFAYVFATGEFQTELGWFIGYVKRTDYQYYSCWFFVFIFLWINAFLSAVNQFILAGAACNWYFSQRDPENQKDKIVEGAVSKSLWWCFRYHLGTLAFGSFILAVIQLAQLILAYVSRQLKQSGADKQSKMIEYALVVCACYLKCFERVIKFINKNAYIYCAITSQSFCMCCKDSFFLIFRNAFLFAIANGIGEVFIFVGKLFITMLTVLLSWYLISQNGEDLNSIYVPLLFILVISWIVGTMFMSVWGMGADSVLVCYALDQELNVASGAGLENQYCPYQLLKFIKQPDIKKQIEDSKADKARQREKYNKLKQDQSPGEKYKE